MKTKDIKYKEIKFSIGVSIESAIIELKKHTELVCGSFNGNMLYSDIDDLDSAYKKITGKTKLECDYIKKARYEEYEEQQKKHKESIPTLRKEWIEKGNAIIDDKYHDLWAECVDNRITDIYNGSELGYCLDIINVLNKGKSYQTAKMIIENQGHSGASFGLVTSMVKYLCNRGNAFAGFISK